MKNEKETDVVPGIASAKIGKTTAKNGEPIQDIN